MNRNEFMKELEELLIDLPEEERTDALQFYIDYFNDAGPDQEQNIIRELESPKKVAAIIKADIRGQEENAQYTENGYTDQRFEEKAMPMYRTNGNASQENKPWTNRWLKIVLITLLIIFALPIVGLNLSGILAAGIAIICTIFIFFFALVIVSVVITGAGVAVMIGGIIEMMHLFSNGLFITGVGMILFVLGGIAILASVKLCLIVYPAIIRFIINLIRIPFYGRK